MDRLSASMDAPRLVRDLEWLSRLAQRLVQDPGLADDAVQEAWLAAARRGGGAGSTPTRPALARALRGILKQSWRTESRRRYRERAAARPEALLSPEEILVIGERQQTLWRHLTALREPYRSTLLRRFQQGAGIETLAEQEGVSADAIRWRIRQGLGKLRESLENEVDGHGVAGLAPLVALATPTGSLSTPGADVALSTLRAASATQSAGETGTLLGMAWMQKKLFVAAGLAVAALVGTVAWVAVEPLSVAERQEAPDVLRDESDGRSQPRNELGSTAGLAVPDTARTASAARTADPHGLTAAAAPQCTIAGRVTDTGGLPLAGADVRVVGGPSRAWSREATTGADGRFELECPRDNRVQANLCASRPPFTGEAWRSFGSGSHCDFPPLTIPLVDVGDVVLEPAGIVRGRVIKGDGAAAEGVSVRVPRVFGSGVETGPDGRFVLTGIVAGKQYVLASLVGHARDGAPVLVEAGTEVEVRTLVVRRGGVLRGRVVDPSGHPIPGARVRDTVVCDANGRFELPVDGPVAKYVSAGAEGYRSSANVTFHVGADASITLHPVGPLARFACVDAATGERVRLQSGRLSEREMPPGEQRGVVGLGGWRHLSEEASERGDGPVWSTLGLPRIDVVHVEAWGYRACEVAVDESAFDGGVQTIEMTRLPMGPLTGRTVRRGVPVVHASAQVLVFEPLDLSGKMVDRGTVAQDAEVWRIKERHKVFTDAAGRFELRKPLTGPVQVVVPLESGDAFVSERRTPAASESLDLGDLPLTRLSSVAGQLAFESAMPMDVAASEYGRIALATLRGDEARRFVPLSGAGQFAFQGLAPGVHALQLDLHVAGRSDRERYYLVDVPRGADADCTLDVGLPALATVELHLTVNGVEWDRDFWAALVERDDVHQLGTSFDEPHGARTKVTVPAHRHYRLLLDLGLTDHNGHFEPAIDVPSPPGTSQIEVNVETAELTLTLPPAWDPAAWGWLELAWTDAAGIRRMPIPAEENLTAPIVRADRSLGHTVRFVSVPVAMRRAQVRFREARMDDADDPIELGEIRLELRPGEAHHVVME